ncbi:histidine triad nucleotide-binding protein [Sciscionella marina]|uniref:histidine triad nucleotide-binding protein n=1 Tax=Sciscionella marina TaxID=508770 RepID=UPI000360A3AF|nr:histidine triad nucleotide-binding protein [Sciscionella marina]
MSEDCLFCSIVSGDIPATIVHETDEVLAFRDLNPQAPTHVLVIPKAHYANAAELAEAEPSSAASLLTAAKEVAVLEGIAKSGYRLVFNTGKDGQQTVFHVHCHVLGGRAMVWPPG